MDIDKLIAVLLPKHDDEYVQSLRDFFLTVTSITDSSFVGFDITDKSNVILEPKQLKEIFESYKGKTTKESGVCQHSCHPYLNQATKTSVALTRVDKRTGLRAVGSTGEQFLTALPFQRAGFTCFAITSTDSRLARISPSLSV